MAKGIGEKNLGSFMFNEETQIQNKILRRGRSREKKNHPTTPQMLECLLPKSLHEAIE